MTEYAVYLSYLIAYMQMNTFTSIRQWISGADVINLFFAYLIRWLWRHFLAKPYNFLISQSIFIFSPNCSFISLSENTGRDVLGTDALVAHCFLLLNVPMQNSKLITTHGSMTSFSSYKKLEITPTNIKKTRLYNFDPPSTPLLYSTTGVYRDIHNFSYFAK